MACNTVPSVGGPLLLAPAMAVRVWITRGGADSAQWPVPDVDRDGQPAHLALDDFTRVIARDNCNTSQHFRAPFIRYGVTVRNIGSAPVHFSGIAETAMPSSCQHVIIVSGNDGRIVAAAPVATDDDARLRIGEPAPRVGVTALPAQTLHVVEMPVEFFGFASACEQHQWLSRRRVALYPSPHLARQ